MNIASSIARVQRGTAFLLALGLTAGSSGAWLLCTAPAGTTADALAHVSTPVARMPEGQRFASALPLATGEGAFGIAMHGVAFGLREGGFGSAVHADRSAIGVEAAVSVEVRAPISGRVASVRFAPGSYVEKGDTLFVLDRAPFAAAVERAQAAVTSARARLGAATAELGRAQRAFDDGAIGLDRLEERVRLQREAHGALRAAATALESARRDLGHTRIVAPIGGRVAAVQVNVGDRVDAAPGGRALLRIESAAAAYAAACGEQLAQAL